LKSKSNPSMVDGWSKRALCQRCGCMRPNGCSDHICPCDCILLRQKSSFSIRRTSDRKKDSLGIFSLTGCDINSRPEPSLMSRTILSNIKVKKIAASPHLQAV
jgi:hypothetical protein